MNEKKAWAILLGISDKDWNNIRSGFLQLADTVQNIKRNFNNIEKRVSEFIENNKKIG